MTFLLLEAALRLLAGLAQRCPRRPAAAPQGLLQATLGHCHCPVAPLGARGWGGVSGDHLSGAGGRSVPPRKA